ncbi:DNA helicase RecQ [Nonlabens xiamenensis]|uniref:DNA helicase RecQ n=1 Tax=Nonlabens xiamenensis TaxID=2341043 RepID=UPI000F604851|nr:DNA helicase RecQ [Nonlabens xiamenensis]
MKKSALLKQYFGYDSFRPLQENIIDKLIAGDDLMVVMPTGGGKSMCYQLPSIMLEGITLVISPLIALMKDQVDALRANGIGAAYFNSSQETHEQQELFEQLASDDLDLLYVAPESIGLLDHQLKSAKISLIAIDEAHCISTWGHDFRPAYTQLSYLKKTYPDTPLVALTATADRATRMDIKKQLGIINAPEYVASFDRPNLRLEVRPGTNRIQQITTFLRSFSNDAGIIYCLSRKTCEGLASKLTASGYNTAAYHAGLSFEERSQVQEDFIKDEVKIVCATIAFGMGIDKSNVRFVIHYNMPKNIEGYYQEIGRAGRDGIDAHALLFHSYADVIQLRRFAEGSGNTKVQLAKLERMKQFAEALTCRRRMLLSYFNEYQDKDCGNCDVCLNPPDFFNATIPAQKALSVVVRAQEQASMNLVIDLLRGAQNSTVLESGLQSIKTFGAGKDISWNNWQQYLVQMINIGLLEIAFHEQNHLKITPQGKAVLFNGRQVELAVVPKKDDQLVKKQRTSQDLPVEVNRQLFQDLKDIRTQLAKAKQLAPYMIFSDASLKDMAARIPLDDNEFADINGVGTHKHDTYGQEFLALLKQHKELRSTAFVYRDQRPKKKSAASSGKKKSKSDTVATTAALFWKDMDVNEIAVHRKLATTTIISHLVKRYESHADVDLSRLVDADILNRILKAYPHIRDKESLKSVFEYFEGKIDYDSLRIGLTWAKNQSVVSN